MADPQGKNRLQVFKNKGKDQDVSWNDLIVYIPTRFKFSHSQIVLRKCDIEKRIYHIDFDIMAIYRTTALAFFLFAFATSCVLFVVGAVFLSYIVYVKTTWTNTLLCEAIHSRFSLFRFIFFLSGRHCVCEPIRFFLFLPRWRFGIFLQAHFIAWQTHEKCGSGCERREIQSTVDLFIHISFLWYNISIQFVALVFISADGLECDEMVSMDRTTEYYISMRILHVQSLH